VAPELAAVGRAGGLVTPSFGAFDRAAFSRGLVMPSRKSASSLPKGRTRARKGGRKGSSTAEGTQVSRIAWPFAGSCSGARSRLSDEGARTSCRAPSRRSDERVSGKRSGALERRMRPAAGGSSIRRVRIGPFACRTPQARRHPSLRLPVELPTAHPFSSNRFSGSRRTRGALEDVGAPSIEGLRHSRLRGSSLVGCACVSSDVAEARARRPDSEKRTLLP